MSKLHLLVIAFSLLAAGMGTPHRRTYLYVGGDYTLNSDGEHIFTDQMYVERLTPVDGPVKEYPIVFIHGADQTATNWLNKPDGSEGWASYFLSQGYECYLLDQTSRGRSPWDAQNGKLRKYSAEFLQKYFTATEKYNLWPQASLHTQWPGTGVMGDSIFDAYYASTVPSLADNAAQESSMQPAGAALLDAIGKPVILVAHSQGGSMSWVIADRRPDLVHSIIAIEPSGPPFQNAVFGSGPARPYGLTDIPITYSPPVTDPATDFVKQTITSSSSARSDCIIQADDPPPRQLVNLSQIPTLVVTTEASYHATHDWCTVRFLRQAGVPTEHLQLEEIGVHGNGHMVFLEKNSDQVVRAIHKWMEGSDVLRMV
ncbi:alpha/beta hydrolase [Aspergillus thermomutatus]|uniref:AB hydrolase-1 domain-containing protein n=1 Tax=Aspergillus thermomutatus TaxID=41047 RepID=A0A397HB98_ASPTH|nr:uncharacterized protein CDV56_106161 [Aspergillus thermomutatus]RHZ59258.1 hypothetical protein CDV56_106161 [Aspergillus thermomutatus]